MQHHLIMGILFQFNVLFSFEVKYFSFYPHITIVYVLSTK